MTFEIRWARGLRLVGFACARLPLVFGINRDSVCGNDRWAAPHGCSLGTVEGPTWIARASTFWRSRTTSISGARILKNYVGQYGLWEGVKRYNGFVASDPISEQSPQQYYQP